MIEGYATLSVRVVQPSSTPELVLDTRGLSVASVELLTTPASSLGGTGAPGQNLGFQFGEAHAVSLSGCNRAQRGSNGRPGACLALGISNSRPSDDVLMVQGISQKAPCDVPLR